MKYKYRLITVFLLPCGSSMLRNLESIIDFVLFVYLHYFFLFELWFAIWCQQHVNRLEITPDKRYVAAAGNAHIRLFDVNSNSPQPVHISLLFFFFSSEILFYFSAFSDDHLLVLQCRWWAMNPTQLMSWQLGFNVMETGCIQDLRMAQ